MLSDAITVCIFAYNEERRLEQTASNFLGLFRMLVIDNCSTDGTAGLCEKLGLERVTVKNPGFIETPEVMDAVHAAVQTPYLLVASCAEVVPVELLRAYAAAANSSTHDVVRAIRVSITAGLQIPISGSPSHQAYDTRMFKRGSIDYSGNKVHDVGRIDVAPDRVLSLPRNRADLYFFQFRDYDCSRTENALTRYGDVLALQRYRSGERFSIFRCLFRSIGHFLLAYLKFGCYRFGMPGFLHAAYRGLMEFTIQLRIWEHQSGLTLSAVIERNMTIKKRMLSDVRASTEDYSHH